MADDMSEGAPEPAAPDEAEPAEGMTYAFKPSLLGALWRFELTPEGLLWRAGQREAIWPYRDIVRVRLSYRPQSLQPQRFRTDIAGRDGRRIALISATWRSMLAVAPQAKSYSAFVRALHEHIAAAGGHCTFVTGLSWPAFVFGLVALGLVALALIVLLVRALIEGYPLAALFMAGFLALAAWQLGGYVWRNRPRHYTPQSVPADLLPSD